MTVANGKVETVVHDGLRERGFHIEADRQCLEVALEADVPVLVEPDSRRGVTQSGGERAVENIFRDLDVVVGRYELQALGQRDPGERLSRAIDDESSVRRN